MRQRSRHNYPRHAPTETALSPTRKRRGWMRKATMEKARALMRQGSSPIHSRPVPTRQRRGWMRKAITEKARAVMRQGPYRICIQSTHGPGHIVPSQMQFRMQRFRIELAGRCMSYPALIARRARNRGISRRLLSSAAKRIPCGGIFPLIHSSV